MVRAWLRDDSGQALSEYGLIIALVAVAAITVLVAFRGSILTKFQTATNSITNAS